MAGQIINLIYIMSINNQGIKSQFLETQKRANCSGTDAV